MHIELVLLRCIPTSYGFLGQNPYPGLTIINVSIATIGFIYRARLRKTTPLFWVQSLIIAIAASTIALFSVVQAMRFNPICLDGLGSPVPTPIPINTDDQIINVLFLITLVLCIILIETIFVSLRQRKSASSHADTLTP